MKYTIQRNKGGCELQLAILKKVVKASKEGYTLSRFKNQPSELVNKLRKGA